MPGQKSMKAGVFTAPGKILLQELPIPAPADGEVLLRVEACGVCGTDYHILQAELTEGVFPPIVLGHEIAARVEAVGPNVDGLKAGQFCAVDPVIGCGLCTMCHSGRPNLCAAPRIIGYKLNGGFAQFLIAPAGQVIPLDEAVGPAGGVLCETLACVINGFERLGLTAGAGVLVLGAGTVGLLWTQILSNSPCRKLLVSEPVAFRRRLAQRLGADVVVDPAGESLLERIRQELPQGADFIIDATGEPQAVQQAVALLAPGGTFLIFGVCPAGSRVGFDPFELYNKQAAIIASKMPPGKLPQAARLIEAGRIACREIVTAMLPLAELPDAVAGFNDRRDRQIKVAIDPWA